ncbi:hypothetical protein [Micromonospora globbae]|uniref:hypothetical protein n=1 Tax=Micromonospora globbae TaxID=1894969 RepID=UPI003432ACF9
MFLPGFDVSIKPGAGQVLGKSRLLSRQCDTCIFAPGNRMHLGPGQLRALVTEAREQGSYIICHDTLPHYLHPQAKPAICRGFADRYRTQALELIERLWGFVEVDPPQPSEQHQSEEGCGQ